MRTQIYTDGACSGNPGPGGWAAIIFTNDNKINLSGSEKETTNNRMELTAVIKGLTRVIKTETKSIHIYSDSAYVVNAVNSKWIKKWIERNWKTAKGDQVKNKDLWLQLYDLIKNDKRINFIKVKGHADNIFNNEADKYAQKEARGN